MAEKIKAFLRDRRELILYYLVGGGTTAVAWGCKYLCNLLLFGGTAYPTPLQNSVLSFVENASAIAYAYPANRRWVFRSRDPGILRKLVLFTFSRLGAWVLGWLLNLLLVSALKVSIFISTVAVGIVCVNVNYLFSKLLVFRRDRKRRA